MIEENSKYQLPLELELLFDNQKLDMFEYLIIAYLVINQSRKKAVGINELAYYYTVFNTIGDKSNTPPIYRHNKDIEKLNMYIIKLFNLKYVNIIGSIDQPVSRLKITLTDEGKKILETNTNETLREFIERYDQILSIYSYGKFSHKFKNYLYKGWFDNEN